MILWLTGKYGYSLATKGLLLNALKSQGIHSTDIIFNSCYTKVPNLAEYPKKGVPAQYIQRAVKHALTQDIEALHPRLIVVNDEGTLRALTDEPYTLAQVRGSVYDFNGTPVLILDQMANLHRMNHGRFIFGLDLAKVARYANGKQKRHPSFNFSVVRNVSDVRRLEQECSQATLITKDTETNAGFVTVQSYTYDYRGSLRTVCVPFFDPWKKEGAYWDTLEEEIEVREILTRIHATEVPKGLANGMYDCAYFIEARMPPVNYFLDTQYMMHAIWCEAPKALHQIASYFCDNYRYWKDDNKDVQEDNWGKTREALEKYWRYNGLDTYWTWLGIVELLARMVKLPWAIKNYNNNISLAVGPCLAASLRGLHVDKRRHAYIMAGKQKEANAGLERVRKLTCEKEFNPRSPDDVAWFLYDVLGMKPTRLQKGKRAKYNARSTDEHVLKLIKEQGNFLADEFIDRLTAAKRPAGVISNFGNLFYLCRNGRFFTWLNPTGTKTYRFNSGKSQFWTGRNAQNIQKPLREFFTADPGYVYLDIDYSASDDRFISYESEDPAKIETVESPKDSHCYHCSIFFQWPYAEIEAGWKADEDWCVAEPQGIRQITKKITHGRNYREGAVTMYNLMGRDAVVAAAVALGHVKAAGYTDKQLIEICQSLIDKYDHPVRGLYRRLATWQDEIVVQCKNANGLMTNAFNLTRKFFGDLDNHKTQRELASQYGQSNTAGNINRSLLRLTYKERLDDGMKVLFLLQVHDSCLFAIHKSAIHLIGDIKRIMEEPVEIHGRMMRVPAAPKVGLTWAKKMMDWTPATTYEDIVAFEKKHFGEKYKTAYAEEANSMDGLDAETIEMLNNIELGDAGDDQIPDEGEQLEEFADADLETEGAPA